MDLQTTGSEFEDSMLDEFAAKFDRLEDYNISDIIAGDISDWLYQDAPTDREFYRLRTRSVDEWREAFLKRYGMADTQYADRAHDLDMRNWTSANWAISERVCKQLILSHLTPTEFRKRGIMFRKRKSGVAISDRISTGGFVSRTEIEKLGFTVEQFVERLVELGVTREPNRKRSAGYTTYYD